MARRILFGLSFAQNPSTTAQEKASDNAAFKRGDAKPNADKMKAEKEKAAKEKAAKEKGSKEKATKEKVKPNIEDVKKQ